MGNFLNAKPSVILYDQLDPEFELSRNAKQGIFTKRRDLSPIEKSEIFNYNNQNKKL